MYVYYYTKVSNARVKRGAGGPAPSLFDFGVYALAPKGQESKKQRDAARRRQCNQLSAKSLLYTVCSVLSFILLLAVAVEKTVQY
jgi:hypothetical protein